MSDSASSKRKSGKFFLKAPPGRTPGQPYSYTETPRPKGEVRFVLPGRKKQTTQGIYASNAIPPKFRGTISKPTLVHPHIETTHFNSTNTPQPFLDPDVLEQWRREQKREQE